jgi:hypothetical protein
MTAHQAPQTPLLHPALHHLLLSLRVGPQQGVHQPEKRAPHTQAQQLLPLLLLLLSLLLHQATL